MAVAAGGGGRKMTGCYQGDLAPGTLSAIPECGAATGGQAPPALPMAGGPGGGP